MKILKKIFKKSSEEDDPQEIMRIVKSISPFIEKTSNNIFKVYRAKFLTDFDSILEKSNKGINQISRMSAIHPEMKNEIAGAINTIYDMLDIKNLNKSQKLAIGFLVSDLIVSKVALKVEALISIVNEEEFKQENQTNSLYNLQPLGNA